MRQQIVSAVLSLLLVSASPLLSQTNKADSVIEPGSRRRFPVHLDIPCDRGSQTLTGTGLRTKTFLKVQVYAVGLYIDERAAATMLTRWQGRTAKELEKDRSFYQTLLRGEVGMSLRLVLTRDVAGADMASAFDEVLTPRVARASAELDMPDGAVAVAQFRRFFSLDKLKKETELIFTWCPGGILMTSIAGRVEREIHSDALLWALFDVYLGDEPISAGIKQGLVQRFPTLLVASDG